MGKKKKHLFKPGESGNPAGRPKGARNKFSERFLQDLQLTWETMGIDALQKVAIEKPDVFVRVAASLVPKQMQVGVSSSLERMLEEINERRRERTIEGTVVGVEEGSDEVRNGRSGGEARLLAGGSLNSSGRPS